MYLRCLEYQTYLKLRYNRTEAISHLLKMGIRWQQCNGSCYELWSMEQDWIGVLVLSVLVAT